MLEQEARSALLVVIVMRIAQIAPLAESVPPKLYGGTERVVAWLANELVELGEAFNANTMIDLPLSFSSTRR